MTYFRRPFAQSGDKLAVPQDDPADGSVSYQTGYGAQYSQNPTTTATARRIERTKFNQVLFDVTTEVQRYQQNAYPEFITSSDNGGAAFSYSKGATVRYSGSVYRSLIDSNTDLPTVATSWYNLDLIAPSTLVPVGTMRALGAGASVPSGYLECDGSAVSRTTYADLFAVIGTTYGVGDGSTTFNLPYGPRRTGIVDNSVLSVTGTNSFALSSAAARAWCNEDGEWFAWVKIEGTKTFNTSGVTMTFGGIDEFETQTAVAMRYNESNPNAELAYTSSATQILCTPPGSNSNVLYVTGEFRLTGEPSWAAANLLSLPVIKT